MQMRGYHMNSRLNQSVEARVNGYCQMEGIEILDRCVCDDGRYDKLFFLYIDGTPLTYYQDLQKNPKYNNITIVFPLDHVGPQLSGPIFRQAILGRPDAEVYGDLFGIDNVFMQIRDKANLSLALHTHFRFPILHSLNHLSFGGVLEELQEKNEGLNSLCRRLSL